MSKIKGISLAYALAGIMSAQAFGSGKETQRVEDLDLSLKQPPIPKGCKEYFFRQSGSFENEFFHSHVFKCIASNDKTAIKKFNKWAAKQ